MDKSSAVERFFEGYGLTKLQISTILKLFESYLADNRMVKGDGVFEVCPKCGKVHPIIVKGGKAGSGKQMYRCTHCGRRFTEDHGTIMHYSHQGDDAWKVLMMDTISGVSLKKTSEKLGLNIETVFSMRHRFLCSLEKHADNIKVSGDVQLDETFVSGSHKSRHIAGKALKDDGKTLKTRGVSKEKVCLATMVDDNGNAFARSYNAGQLTSREAMNLASHMAGSCSMTTDRTSVYDQLASATGSFHQKTEDRKDSKAEVNLNRINSFHSVIKSYYRHYRGVASKYINRYASMIAYAWKMTCSAREDERYEQTLSIVRKDCISLTGEELRDYRLYAPDDLVYRAA